MKKHLQLTPRLQAAADWVPEGARLCDVGTDHAYLPVALLLEGRISAAIASDIRSGPLNRAANTATAYQQRDAVDLRLCPGLEGIQAGETDTVTICGMGGEMICGILQAAPWTKAHTTLILQPMRSQAELRTWLYQNGYHIEAERAVREDQRWYTVLLVKGGAEPVSLTAGQRIGGEENKWLREPQRAGYLEALLKQLERQYQGVMKSTKTEDEPRRAELKHAIEELSVRRDTILQGGWFV